MTLEHIENKLRSLCTQGTVHNFQLLMAQDQVSAKTIKEKQALLDNVLQEKRRLLALRKAY